MSVTINTEELLNEALDEEQIFLPNGSLEGTDNYVIPEEDFLMEVEDDFEYQIKERGKKYYNSGNVLKVVKNGSHYYAKVKGSSITPYNINVTNDENGIDYECDCPYDFPCKHEYAVLIAISNGEYEQIELKPEIREKKASLQSMIEIIPADEIKNYLLSPKGLDYVCFEMESFEDYFRKYLPKQKYDFYYNNLYNELILNNDGNFYIKDYLSRVKQYIDNNDFPEGYKIIKSIIEAYNDSNKLNIDDTIVDSLPKIGMFLRVVYRKCDHMTKDNINKWIENLERNNYYNNYYLEDIIVSLENGR